MLISRRERESKSVQYHFQLCRLFSTKLYFYIYVCVNAIGRSATVATGIYFQAFNEAKNVDFDIGYLFLTLIIARSLYAAGTQISIFFFLFFLFL